MTGEKEEKVEQKEAETKAKAKETPTPEAQEKVFTQKDLDDAIAKQKEESDKSYQGLQKVINKKDKQIEELGKRSQSADSTSTIKALTGEVKRIASESGVDTSGLTELESRLEMESRRVMAEAIITQEKQKLTQQITSKGFDPEDEMFDSVWDSFDHASAYTGDWSKPQARLERTLAKATPKTEKSDEEKTLREKAAKWDEEEKRRQMEEGELLKTDVSFPSGSGGLSGLTRETLAQRMSTPEGLKWFRENEKDIDRLMREGKIK